MSRLRLTPSQPLLSYRYFFIFLSTGTSWLCNSLIYLRHRRVNAAAPGSSTVSSLGLFGSEPGTIAQKAVGRPDMPSATSTMAEMEDAMGQRPQKESRGSASGTLPLSARAIDEETLGGATLSDERNETAESTITAMSNRVRALLLLPPSSPPLLIADHARSLFLADDPLPLLLHNLHPARLDLAPLGHEQDAGPARLHHVLRHSLCLVGDGQRHPLAGDPAGLHCPSSPPHLVVRLLSRQAALP
jgi:hypothetical protein